MPSKPKPYVDLSRGEWSALRERTPLPLDAAEVEQLRGLGDVIDLDEVREIFLPPSPGCCRRCWPGGRSTPGWSGSPPTASSCLPPSCGGAG